MDERNGLVGASKRKYEVKKRTIDDPFLDLALFDVYRGGDLGVRQILADILESERRKREQPHFMLQLSLIKTCTVTHVQAC